jgi:hypothetical protein
MRHTVGHLCRRVAAAALVLVPVTAIAQLTPVVDATVGPARAGGESSTPLGALSPAMRVDLARFAASASGDLPLSGALHGVAGRGAFVAGAPLGRGWRVAGGAAAERGARWAGVATWRAGLAAQLAYTRGAGGVWGGVEAARVVSVEGALPFRGLGVPNGLSAAPADTLARGYTLSLDPAAYRTTGLSLGAWRSLGSLVGTVAVRAGMERLPGLPPTFRYVDDSIFVREQLPGSDTSAFGGHWEKHRSVFGDSGSASTLRRLAEAETRVTWTRGRVAVVGAAGVRLADWAGVRLTQGPNTARVAWATLDGMVALGRFAAVTLGAGTRPPAADVAALLAGVPAPAGGRARYASVGLRLSPTLFQRPALPPAVRPSAAMFALAPAAERGQYTLRVRVPAARVVELSGDFTKWHPVTMQRVSADAWEVVLPIERGTHHVSIRVDGDAWNAPPGLARVADDFDGSAGVLVVP